MEGVPDQPVEPPSPLPTPTPSPTPAPNPDPETPPEPREPKPDTPAPSPGPIRVPPPDTPPPGPGEPATPLPTTSPIPPLPPSSEGTHCQGYSDSRGNTPYVRENAARNLRRNPSLSNGRRIRSRYGRRIGATYFSFFEKEGVLSVHMTQD